MTAHSPDHAERAAIDVAAICADEAVRDAIRVMRLTSAHADEDADDQGQSRTATDTAANLELAWQHVRLLWKAMAFPKGVEDAGRMADEMDRLLAVRAALNDEGKGVGDGR